MSLLALRGHRLVRRTCLLLTQADIGLISEARCFTLAAQSQSARLL